MGELAGASPTERARPPESEPLLDSTSPSALTRCHLPYRGEALAFRKVFLLSSKFSSPPEAPLLGELSNGVRLRGCTKGSLPSAARPALLRHIGNAPVHWHEETFSSGGILLSDENATVFLTSSDLQPVAPTQTATLNAICFFFNRIKIFQASIPQAERISYTVLFHALPVTLLSEDHRGQ